MIKTMNKLPCITILRPWANLIADGLKTIETREDSRFKSLVGKRIGIHAARKYDNEVDKKTLWSRNRWKVWEDRYYYESPGCIIATAYVQGIIKNLTAEFKMHTLCECAGKTGIFLADINKLENPIPAKGQQGIWYYKGGI